MKKLAIALLAVALVSAAAVFSLAVYADISQQRDLQAMLLQIHPETHSLESEISRANLQAGLSDEGRAYALETGIGVEESGGVVSIIFPKGFELYSFDISRKCWNVRPMLPFTAYLTGFETC